jgi:hypothetical protein
MRMRSVPRGLMVIGTVLVAAAVVAAADGTPSPPGGCSVCSTQMTCPALQSVKVEILDTQNGIAMLMTVSDPARLVEFHQSWDQCKAEMEKALKMSRDESRTHLCAMCQGYYDLCHQGARFESMNTETGVLSLLTAKKSKLVNAIHAQAAKEREMMAKKEPCCTPP